MKQLAKRINQLESQNKAGAKPVQIDRVIIDSSLQHRHPERFTKRLIRTESAKGYTRNFFELEPKPCN